MTTSYPGVYMREVSSGVRPIQAASTSTPAFLGVSERGPIGEPVSIVNFTQFKKVFGGFLESNFLAHSVFQFFNNGGSRCYVVRVAASDAATASATIRDRQDEKKNTLWVSANAKGGWGNDLEIEILDGSANPGSLFDMVVRKNAKGDKAPIELERFANLSMNPQSRDHVEKRVNGSSKYLVVTALANAATGDGGFIEGRPLSPSFQPDATHRKLNVNIDGDGYQEIDLSGDDLTTPAAIAASLQRAIRALSPLRRDTPATSFTAASAQIRDIESEEEEPENDANAPAQRTIRITSGSTDANSSVAVAIGSMGQDIAALLALVPPASTVDGSAPLRPTIGTFLIGDGVASDEAGALAEPQPGSDGGTAQPLDFVTALPALDVVRDVSLIAIPGIGDENVAGAAMNYCKGRPLSDCFYLADMEVHDTTVEQAKEWADNVSPPNSHGAVYFPWLMMLDPNGGTEPIAVPPSGFVAGVYARTDNERGVWKTPAGTQASVAGAVGLTVELTDTEHGLLNDRDSSVSVIRRFTSSGYVIWGGRTISSDREWRYIAPRRMAIFLRASIFDGIQWAVFEPNDEPLWSQLRINLTAFMMTLFRKGAFQGSTPSEAFFVKVDSETTTQDDINDGRVNILVGFAPSKPAEFVVVELSQSAGQAS